MDAYCDRSYTGWDEGLAAAEGQCVRVFLPTGEQIMAVPQTRLVELRSLPGRAQKAVES